MATLQFQCMLIVHQLLDKTGIGVNLWPAPIISTLHLSLLPLPLDMLEGFLKALLLLVHEVSYHNSGTARYSRVAVLRSTKCIHNATNAPRLHNR